MDVLQAIVHSQAGYLDESVLRLLAAELKKRPAGPVKDSGKGKKRPRPLGHCNLQPARKQQRTRA